MFLLSKLKPIKTFVFDMDGVLTDGSFIVSENEWLRRMNVKDGYALQLAVAKGYNVLVVSGSHSDSANERLRKLGIEHIFTKIKTKEIFLKQLMAESNLSFSETLFMGDDIPDYECMKMVEVAACPSDACFDIKAIADYISPFKGGEGCVRDVIEKVLKLNNHWPLSTSITSS